VLEPSDRATVYFDPRTLAKDENKGMRVPMDVWYGQYWGRIQGNNKERRARHHNQIPEVYLERVIRACSNEGSLVLDPFLGSGTTVHRGPGAQASVRRHRVLTWKRGVSLRTHSGRRGQDRCSVGRINRHLQAARDLGGDPQAVQR
jgi:hypothetical protein